MSPDIYWLALSYTDPWVTVTGLARQNSDSNRREEPIGQEKEMKKVLSFEAIGNSGAKVVK